MVRALTLALLTSISLADSSRAQSDIAVELERHVQAIRHSGSISIEGITLTDASGIVGLYEKNGYRPYWTNSRRAAELDAVIRGITADGLRPADYHHVEIMALEGSRPSAVASARLDLLRTDALVRLRRDLRYGRVTPSPSAPADAGDELERDSAAILRMIRSGRLSDELDEVRPRHFVYRGLMAALAQLRRIEEAGGWTAIPHGVAMRRDSVDARVPALRERLLSEGYIEAGDASSELRFDAALEAAVRTFQHRHGLNEDGVVGPATLAALNVPVATRIEQVRANLERARWIAHELPLTFLAVNVAGAKAYLIREGDVVFESRAVVGATSTRTPVFRAELNSLDLNPTWTVPPGIVGEVLAAARRDPGYLDRNGFTILDRSGRRVDASHSDLSSHSARSFPWVFRQGPGPANPLGRIKFVFPNRYHVYLHDTPARELFQREQRTFSHGCIRVQDPLRLAELVLDDDAWSRSAIETALSDGRTKTIRLATPLPVLLLYWTAAADLHGELHYYADVYGRDAALLSELNRR